MEAILALLSLLIAYIGFLIVGIIGALTFNQKIYEVVSQYPHSSWVLAGIVVLAGGSTLIGQSAVLFLNRVRRGRFFISIITSGFMLLVTYTVWGLIIALTASVLFDENPGIWTIVRLVALSTAPLVFGFLILIPWMGPFVGKVLNIWSGLILINIIQYEFQSAGFWGALTCVAIGWLISMGLERLVGKPLVALRNRMFQSITGSSMDASARDILMEFSLDDDGTTVLDGGDL